MNTRVVQSFDCRLGINLYSVYKWAEWDDSELRDYCRGKPDQYAWRYADLTTPDLEFAKGYAERLSMDASASPERVVYEVAG